MTPADALIDWVRAHWRPAGSSDASAFLAGMARRRAQVRRERHALGAAALAAALSLLTFGWLSRPVPPPPAEALDPLVAATWLGGSASAPYPGELSLLADTFLEAR